MTAYLMGQASKGNKMMVFDWDKAASLIVQHDAKNAEAGLRGDWEYTGGNILQDGKPNLDDYTFLASIWATPQLQIYGDTHDCYVMSDEVPEAWGNDFANIKWPESALNILAGNPVETILDEPDGFDESGQELLGSLKQDRLLRFGTARNHAGTVLKQGE